MTKRHVNARRVNASGFTIVELLVATAVLGILLSALIFFTTSTLRFSQIARSQSDFIQELSDVTGYIGDNVRRAALVSTDGTVSVNGNSCNISNTSNPCIVLVVPEDTGAGGGLNYLLLAYRVEARTALPDAQRTDNAWADANTEIIREYRTTLCSACALSDVLTSGTLTNTTITGATELYVLDLLALNDDGTVLGGGDLPFQYDATTGETTLNLRLQDRVRSQVRTYPQDAPYTQSVFRRN
jgi:prepilin-type N-terminal cleavage/methylation domain-containing protein